MRTKLFWKILLSFWLAFFLAVPLVWIPVTILFGEHPPAPGESVVIIPGEDGAPDRERRLGEGMSILTDPSGDPEEFRTFTAQILIVGAVTGLLFSIALARHLTQPVTALKEGFRQLADGHFDVDMVKEMGGRRDELAELAREFDKTAQRIQDMVIARERLLHELSHEIRTPLSRLLIATSIFQQKPERAQEMGLRIEKEVAILSHLVGEVLALARVENDTGCEEQYYDPVLVLQEVVEDARIESQSKRVAIDFSTSEEARPGAITVGGNPQMLVRACENVVRNAIRFAPHGSTIRVIANLTTGNKREFKILVADEGPGIRDEALPQIFDDFSPSDGSGFGFGLSIARRAIDAQRGSIRALNLDEGGLCIEIVIPQLISGHLEN